MENAESGNKWEQMETEPGTGTGPHHSLLTALTTRFQVVGLLVVHQDLLTRDKRIVIYKC